MTRPPRGHDILIVGGYGTVGRRIAADLAHDYPGRLVVAGRSLERGAELALALGHGVRAGRTDVDDPVSVDASLDGVGVVVSCIDQREPHLLRAAIAHGLAYTDITPHLMQRRPTEGMRVAAADAGARIVLGAGLAPGISSMLARLAADRVGVVESVTSSVLLSVGDGFGPASRAYIIEEIALPYTVVIGGRRQEARAFAGASLVPFPMPIGPRRAYRFPFSDQVFFPETLGAHTAVSGLALDPPWLGRLMAALTRLGVPSLLRQRARSGARLSRLLAWLQRAYAGRDWYGLVVEVSGVRGTVRASLVGRVQAHATALGAASLARSLIEEEVDQPGIWLAEQIVPVDRFFERLAKRGLEPAVDSV